MPSSTPVLRPMLPSTASEPFDSPDHVFDLKWGGIRALAFIQPGRLRLVSQAGRDISALFPELSTIADQASPRRGVIDGEIIALSPEGEPSLAPLASRLGGAPSAAPVACLYQAFDILE